MKSQEQENMWRNLFASFAFCFALILLAGGLSLSSRPETSVAQAPQPEDRLPYALVAIHVRLQMLEKREGLAVPAEFTADLDNLMNMMTAEGKLQKPVN